VSGPNYRLTELADDDINSILAYTLREFGLLQLEAYSKLIDKVAQMVGQSPMRPGSKARDELGEGVRCFHVELAASRRGAAFHNPVLRRWTNGRRYARRNNPPCALARHGPEAACDVGARRAGIGIVQPCRI
jgi:plasmid stabilization system protein ParE